MVTLAKNGKGTVMVTGQNHNFYSSINIVKFNFLKTKKQKTKKQKAANRLQKKLTEFFFSGLRIFTV
jgi:hypothetical protein